VNAASLLGLVGPVWEPAVLPRSTFEMADEGAYADVPIMIGTMADENRLFMMADAEAQKMDFDALVARCEGVMPGRGREIAETYRDGCAGRGDPGNPADIWFATQTDSFFRAPAMKLASKASRHGAVFAYLMTQKSPVANGALGACHALDLPFVFGLGNDPGMKNFAGEGPELERLSLAMQDAWLAFAKTGSPTHEGLPWERYDEATRATMIFDAAGCRIENGPREAERAIWG
jgi:para-nitrobenzyl esterase